MRSMTGFGRGESSDGVFTVEISGVNRKQLEMRFSLPGQLLCAETALRNRISAKVSRGNIVVKVSLNVSRCAGVGALDMPRLEMIVADARKAAEKLGLSPDIRMGELLGLPGVVSGDCGMEFSGCPEELVEAFDRAFAAFDAMRLAEGRNLSADLSGRLGELSEMTDGLRAYGADLTIKVRDRLMNVLRDSGIKVDYNDERVLKEVVFFADRADVTEELTRLDSHFVQFREFLRSEAPVGRSLDFLIQEMFREITTFGNKASGTGASRLVVEYKTALEKMREQIQNIE